VVIRIKPPNFPESINAYYDQQSISLDQKTFFSFDHIFDHSTTQEEIFRRLGVNIINNIVKGYNGCIFAYGQTGSGKTHTMTGTDGDEGLIQRCLKNLWSLVQKF
jgi:chromosomal replication initiation ATPase DnaA